MPDTQDIIDLLYGVIDQINGTRKLAEHLPKRPETALSGDSGMLDSLGLVNFIVATEQTIEMRFQVSLMLIDESQMFAAESPVATVGTLAAHIERLLKDARRA